MSTILISASYLQNSDRPGSDRLGALLSICERSPLGSTAASRRIWELLETPQTVATICRVLSHEHRLDPQMLLPAVESLLAELYESDLIQVSPDT